MNITDMANGSDEVKAADKRCTAVVLAGGSGSRMKSVIPKQYMPVAGKPLIWYALNAVQNSRIIDDCILVAGADDLRNVQKNIVEKYHFTKVRAVTAGGFERCFSVGNALKAMGDGGSGVSGRGGYVFIHDGARPFLTEKMLEDLYRAVEKYHACVAAVPSKDTIKIADENGFVASTPSRDLLWSIQTPQVFDRELVSYAYSQLTEEKYEELKRQGIAVTDDAGVVELFTDTKVKLVMGAYENIKITTPGDIAIAESMISFMELNR